jgi:quercetin dioxygenase-like cupin family protein
VTYDVVNPPQGPADVVQLVLDFAPASFTPAHTHPGPTFVTVLEGAITRRVEGTEETFQAGQGWVEPGRVHAAGNTTDASAHVLVTAVLPAGAPLTTIAATGATAQITPGPRTVAKSRRPLATPPNAPYDLHHVILDVAPSAISPAHTHGGPTYVTVHSGQMQRRAEGVEETFSPSQTWEEPGVPHAAGNRAQSPASVGIAYLVPGGQDVTHVVQEPRACDGCPQTHGPRAHPSRQCGAIEPRHGGWRSAMPRWPGSSPLRLSKRPDSGALAASTPDLTNLRLIRRHRRAPIALSFVMWTFRAGRPNRRLDCSELESSCACRSHRFASE